MSDAQNKPTGMQLYAGLSTAAIVILVIAVIWLAYSLFQASAQLSQAGGPPEGPPGGGPPPQLVRVDLVRMETVQRKRLVTGQIEAVQESMVAAEESGLVIQAPPEQGTAVKKGDVLAKLDPQLLLTTKQVAIAQLNEANARVSQAQATESEATALVERYRQLIEDGAITQVDFDRAVRDSTVGKAQVATAKAAVASRKAEIDRIDIQLEKMTVRAPFDGYIIDKHAELGQWLAPGGTVAELVHTQQVDAVLQVPESMIGAVDVGASVNVLIPGVGRTVTGDIFRIVPNADRDARTVKVLIRLDNPEATIKPGMSSEAELPTGQEVEALTVPRSSVKTTPLGLQVWANRGNVGLPVNVVGKFMVGDRMVIEANLGPGEQVVIEGNERLYPGIPLNVQNADDFPAKPDNVNENEQPQPDAQ